MDIIVESKDLYTEETTDVVLAEIMKKLIPTKIRAKLSSKKDRHSMIEKFGKSAFLLPDQLKFPVVNPESGKPDCGLIYAARARARQYSGVKPGYREIAEKAEELYKKHGCSTKAHIKIQDGEEVTEIDLQSLIEILY